MLLGYVVGFVDDGDLVWGFTAAGFKEVVGGVGAPTAITTMMAERGLLVTQNDRSHRFSKRIDGRTQNVVAVKASALDGEEA